VIVVDANIAAYLFIQGERTALAQEVWRLDSDWRLPGLWRHEFLNVLATLARSGVLDYDSAVWIWSEALQRLESGEAECEMPEALALALTRKISAYDAQYASLAARLGVPLITEDRKLRQALPGESLSMAEFLELSSES
jgi:predicted nucleic acid-binding protein